MKTNISFSIVFLSLFILSTTKVLSMAESLKEKCISAILAHPENILKDPSNKINIPSELEDVIREKWFSAHKMTNPWWAQLCAKNLVKVAEIGAHGAINLNNDHTILKTEAWVGPEVSDTRTAFYDMNGNILNPLYRFKPGPVFIPEDGISDVDEDFLHALGFKPRFQWLVGYKGKRTKHNKLIVSRINMAEIFDLSLYDNFLNYAQERMPLAQLLLLQVFEQSFEESYNKNSKLELSPEEHKIVNAMPPQFEQMIKFLKECSK